MELKYEIYDFIISSPNISNEQAIVFLRKAMTQSTPFELIRLIDYLGISGLHGQELDKLRVKAVRLYNEDR